MISPLPFAMNAVRGLILKFTLAAILATSFAPEATRAGADSYPRVTNWPLEISGATRLPDGRLLLVDDETRDAVFLADRDLARMPERIALPVRLDDLEAAAADSGGAIYLLTSHSATKRGRLRGDRQRLVRLHLGAEGAEVTAIVEDLRPALLHVLTPPATGGPTSLNLEGLAWYPGGNQLVLGARTPLQEGRAVVIWLGSCDDLLAMDRPAGAIHPRVETLDLGGRGVRALEYDPWRRCILVLAGPAAGDDVGYAIYLWAPGGGTLVELEVQGLGAIRQPEGIVALGPPGVDGAGPILVAGEGAPPVRLTARSVTGPASGGESER